MAAGYGLGMTAASPSSSSALLDAFRFAGQPLATIQAPTPSDVADAEHRFEVRRSKILSQLDELDAPTGIVDAVTEALDGRHHDDGAGLLLVAAESGLLVDHCPREAPTSHVDVTIGPTPKLLGALAAAQAEIGHGAVLLDRVGADIWVRDAPDDNDGETDVDGQELHVHRGHPGGWSQQRFQQRAENTWEANAKLVVEEIIDALGPDADVIVVGGDVRAVGFFVEHVPSRYEVIEVDGSRSADHDSFLENADAEIRAVAARRLVDQIDEVRSAIGAGTGVAGQEVLDLLTQGRVERVYVVDDTDSDDRPTSAFDFSVPMHLPPDHRNGDDATVAPVTEAAVTLATATGADVVVLPATGVAGVDGPLAAIVR